jgi:transformation/transcription domain-associated protein
MDNIPQMGTGQDLEMCAARIADPGVGLYTFEHLCVSFAEDIFSDLQTKYTVACELREMIDIVRDADSGRVLPQMVPALLDLLRSGEVAFQKDAREYHFRRVLIEILHRISCNEVIHGQFPLLFKGMLYLLRHDNEENGVTCCKTLIDLYRTFRTLTEDIVEELMSIFQLVSRNMRPLVDELLSEESALLDEKVLLPSVRSFKVLAEMGMVIVAFASGHRHMLAVSVQSTFPLNFEVLGLESPAQKIARENYEAMGGIWAGMASTIKNHHAYADFITAQIKARECFLTFRYTVVELCIDGLLPSVYHAWIGRTQHARRNFDIGVSAYHAGLSSQYYRTKKGVSII